MKESTDAFVRSITEKQKETDQSTREMAAEIVEAQGLLHLDAAKRFAESWIETAAQHARNEDYWRKRALKAERPLWKRILEAIVVPTPEPEP